jgi:hypothetical protein
MRPYRAYLGLSRLWRAHCIHHSPAGQQDVLVGSVSLQAPSPSHTVVASRQTTAVNWQRRVQLTLQYEICDRRKTLRPAECRADGV